MHKNKDNYRKRQSFADFTEKLGAKWRSLTMSTQTSRGLTNRQGTSDIASIFERLVSTPTITGNYQANHDALRYIEEFLSSRGMHIARHECNGVESLVATTRRTKTPEIMLAAHLDVVPADERLFTLRKEGDKLYGRGTLDMKFAIAAYMSMVDDLRHNLSAYDFGIMITTDEEAGGTDGTAYLVKEGYLPKACIIPDGGDDWQMQTHAKGMFWLSLTADGKPAHASRPWLGDNAILRLLDTIQDITKLFEGHNAETKTLNVGKINGGRAINQVADRAEALIDIRLMTEEEKAPLLTHIQAICEKYGTEISVVIDGAVASFPLSNPYLRKFADIITEVTGVEVKGSSTLGTNDSRYFAEHNIPCISVYPPGGGHHGVGEWVSAQGLHDFHQILTRYITHVAAR